MPSDSYMIFLCVYLHVFVSLQKIVYHLLAEILLIDTFILSVSHLVFF